MASSEQSAISGTEKPECSSFRLRSSAIKPSSSTIRTLAVIRAPEQQCGKNRIILRNNFSRSCAQQRKAMRYRADRIGQSGVAVRESPGNTSSLPLAPHMLTARLRESIAAPNKE
jgi:hypothetical protein